MQIPEIKPLHIVLGFAALFVIFLLVRRFFYGPSLEAYKNIPVQSEQYEQEQPSMESQAMNRASEGFEEGVEEGYENAEAQEAMEEAMAQCTENPDLPPCLEACAKNKSLSFCRKPTA